jgi:hypothetical protein
MSTLLDTLTIVRCDQCEGRFYDKHPGDRCPNCVVPRLVLEEEWLGTSRPDPLLHPTPHEDGSQEDSYRKRRVSTRAGRPRGERSQRITAAIPAILELRRSGLSLVRIAAQVHVSQTSVERICFEHGVFADARKRRRPIFA